MSFFIFLLTKADEKVKILGYHIELCLRKTKKINWLQYFAKNSKDKGTNYIITKIFNC